MVEYQIHDEAGFLAPFVAAPPVGTYIELDKVLYIVVGQTWDNNSDDALNWRCVTLVKEL